MNTNRIPKQVLAHKLLGWTGIPSATIWEDHGYGLERGISAKSYIFSKNYGDDV